MPRLALSLTLTVLAVLTAACGSDGSDLAAGVADQADPTPTVAREVATPESAPAADAEAEPSATADVDDVVPEQAQNEENVGNEENAPELYPDVLAAEAEQQDGTWTFQVTMSSPYDSPQRYADAWRVLAPDGTELGVRVLTHDHASEQPFTRSLSGVEIPDDVTTVTIQGRDQLSGWGGATVDLTLARTAT